MLKNFDTSICLSNFVSVKKIAIHIENLLRRHDYVIVPGLGGFLFQQQSAVINYSTIEPPKSSVSFNPLMSSSDGLLTIEVSRMNGISFREASSVISEEVDNLYQSLKAGKKSSLGQLGEISLDSNGKIIFEPSEDYKSIPVNFGLATLHVSQLKATEEIETRKTIILHLPPARKIARYVAIGIIAVGVFFATPKLNDATRNLAAIFPHDFSIHNNVVYQAPPQLPQEIVNLEEETNLVEEQLPNVEEQNPNDEKSIASLNHHVVVSCMNTEKEANNMCDYLKKNDYSEAHILSKSRIHRVIIQSFESKNAAINFMENLRKEKSQFADAWVLSE